MKKKKLLFLLSQQIEQRFKEELSKEDLAILAEFVRNFKPRREEISLMGKDKDSAIENLIQELSTRIEEKKEEVSPNLIFYKISDNVNKLPKRSTPGSAGIDLFANFKKYERLSCFNALNEQLLITIEDFAKDTYQITIRPGHRVLVPTGVTSTFSSDYVALMYARSGNAFKRGLNLINSVGVIDSDYRNEWFVPIFNNTDKDVIIREGEAIAQVIMTPISKQNPIHATKEDFENFKKQELDNERKGGFGSSDKV